MSSYQQNKQIKNKIFLDIEKDPNIVLKNHLVIITGGIYEAIILNQFVYWTITLIENTKELELKVKEEKIAILDSDDLELKKEGWIYKSAIGIEKEIMIISSSVISECLDKLVKKGFLERRKNPKIGWDRTYQYRVNIDLYNEHIQFYIHLNDEDLLIVPQENTKSETGKRKKITPKHNLLMLSDVYNQHYVTATRECITCTRESITCTRECITATREAIPEITTETTIEITPNNIPNIFLKEIPLASSSKKKEKDLIINNTSKLDIQNKIDKNKEKFDLFCLEHFKDEGKKVFDFFSGLTLYCNSKDKDYINLLEFYLKNSSKKEIMDFIRVYGPFQTECIELLGEKDGTFLAEFFTTFFSDAQKKNGLKKSMNNKDRLKNIKNLINLFGKEKLLACAHKFQDDEKQGRIRVHDYNYFVGAVEKFKIQGETKPTIEPEKKIIKSMKPVIFERITENYEMDFLNYSYKCECGTIHDGWAVECKKCGMIYDWH